VTPRPSGAGRLVLVATPIGNLGDLSPRAVEALRTAALICAEDTRRTGRLLAHAGVRGVPLAVANEHTEAARVADVLEVLAEGADVALVTDAGTPGISDPGERLVRAVLDAGYDVSTVPGPVAAVAALVISGLPAGRFVFEGFLPRAGRARRERLAELAAEPRTIVLYEAPHRVVATVRDLAAALGDDRAVVAVRELTKLYETTVRGTLGALDLGSPRGEYVLVVAGRPADDRPPDDDAIRDALRAELMAGASTRDAATAVARRLAVAKRTAYALAVGLGAAGPASGRRAPADATVRHGASASEPVTGDDD
jgi:16S rRNA (cytidine1402-2'-O)-methyltransferase